MTARRFGDFGLAIDFDVDHAILGVRGDVDLLTSPTLGAVVDALVDQGHDDVVLDLAALAFMDASGLGIIASTAVRLRTSGGVLTLRSPPAQTRRILDITGMTELLHIEPSDPKLAALGPEQHPDDLSPVVDAWPADLVADLARVAAMPASNDVVDAALRLVTALASATVEGADGVSVTLNRHGRLMTVASSNDTVRRMDAHQYETGEGPCLAAAAEGRWFHIASLVEDDRWPLFLPRALEEGIASILSSPLITADRPVGALNIYSSTERAFGPQQQELAALFATQASGILADAGLGVTDEDMATRIADGLRAREVIAQAQGVLMARRSATADHAAAVLHRSARAANVTVRQHAAAILASAGDDSEQVPAGPGRA